MDRLIAEEMLKNLEKRDEVLKMVIRWLMLGGMSVNQAVKFAIGYGYEKN